MRLESSTSEVYQGTPVSYSLRIIPAPVIALQVRVSADAGDGSPIITSVDVIPGQSKVDFSIQGLPPGSYTILASIPGFPSSESAKTQVRVQPRKIVAGSSIQSLGQQKNSAESSSVISSTKTTQTSPDARSLTTNQFSEVSSFASTAYQDTCRYNGLLISKTDCQMQTAKVAADCTLITADSARDACLWQLWSKKVFVPCTQFNDPSLRQSCQAMQSSEQVAPQ